jgi:hypothetical protein
MKSGTLIKAKKKVPIRARKYSPNATTLKKTYIVAPVEDVK